MNTGVEMLDSQVKCIINALSPTARVVEIGAYAGKLTIAMAKKGCRVFSVDPYLPCHDKTDMTFGENMQDVKKIFLEKISEYKNIEYFCGTSACALTSCDYLVYDAIVLDGDHSAKGIAIDKAWIERLNKDGLIIIHDYADFFPAIQKFVDTELKGKYQELLQESSLIIFHKTEVEK